MRDQVGKTPVTSDRPRLDDLPVATAFWSSSMPGPSTTAAFPLPLPSPFALDNPSVPVVLLNHAGEGASVVGSSGASVALDRGAGATRPLDALLAVLREGVPIVAMTAAVMPGDYERCLAGGMDDHLAKPVEVPVLAAVLSRWVWGDVTVPATAGS